MKIVIAGASGFLGKFLIEALKDHELVALDRKPGRTSIRTVVWDGETLGEWTREIDGADTVINLSGAPITLKWTPENRQLIRDSRVKPTTAIGQAILQAARPPKIWLNGSAVGFYVNRGNELLDELSKPGEDFLSQTCIAWEAAVAQVETPDTRRIALRTGLPLHPTGGVLAPLLKLTQAFLGGAQGDGKHWMPWIHIHDFTRLVTWLLESDLEGPVNATSPNPVTNETFMRTLRHVVGRPWSPPAPKFALEMVGRINGPDPETILASTRALPRLASESGFTWEFPELDAALRNLL